MLPIQTKLISYNHSQRQGSIRYIVIHDTGNDERGANANAHFNYFNGGNRGASADYFVDDNNIIKMVEAYNRSWHCGDGHGMNGITNDNSIGIEICINRDGDYEQAVRNTIELTKHLMSVHNVSLDRVVRHYDVSYKHCPNTMMDNDWAKWKWFKAQLSGASVPSVEETVNDTIYSGTVTASCLNVRNSNSTDSEIIGTLSNGETVRISKNNSKGDWYSIYYGNHGGWISAKYIDCPQMGQASVSTKEESKIKYGTVTANCLNVRDGASTDSPIIGSLERGTRVKVGVPYIAKGWHNIYFGNHGGYVSADYIKLEE